MNPQSLYGIVFLEMLLGMALGFWWKYLRPRRKIKKETME